MAAKLAAAISSRIGFSIYIAVYARRVRVPGGSKFHLAPGTIVIHRYSHLGEKLLRTTYNALGVNLTVTLQVCGGCA